MCSLEFEGWGSVRGQEDEPIIEKTVKRLNLTDSTSARSDLAYWLTRPPEDRVAAVDLLRKQDHGGTVRPQRSARVMWEAAHLNRESLLYGDVPVFLIGKEELVSNKKATGRKRDLADLEALGEC